MTQYANNVGRGLRERVYRVVGGFMGVQDIDLDAPIQRVLDVHRQDELEAIQTDRRAGSFFQVGDDHVHAIAGSLTAALDPYASLDASWGQAEQRWVWLIRAALTATADVLAAQGASLNVGYPALGNALALRDFPICFWTNSGFTIDNGGTGSLAYQVSGNLTQINPLPILVPIGGRIRTFSQVSAAGTIRFQTICWVGPIGVYPPGIA